jgi:hypothetical protein
MFLVLIIGFIQIALGLTIMRYSITILQKHFFDVRNDTFQGMVIVLLPGLIYGIIAVYNLTPSFTGRDFSGFTVLLLGLLYAAVILGASLLLGTLVLIPFYLGNAIFHYLGLNSIIDFPLVESNLFIVGLDQHFEIFKSSL